jgi:hypothetical protein
MLKTLIKGIKCGLITKFITSTSKLKTCWGIWFQKPLMKGCCRLYPRGHSSIEFLYTLMTWYFSSVLLLKTSRLLILNFLKKNRRPRPLRRPEGRLGRIAPPRSLCIAATIHLSPPFSLVPDLLARGKGSGGPSL